MDILKAYAAPPYGNEFDSGNLKPRQKAGIQVRTACMQSLVYIVQNN